MIRVHKNVLKINDIFSVVPFGKQYISKVFEPKSNEAIVCLDGNKTVKLLVTDYVYIPYDTQICNLPYFAQFVIDDIKYEIVGHLPNGQTVTKTPDDEIVYFWSKLYVKCQ